MKFNELFEKYQTLLAENGNLKREIKKLRSELEIRHSQVFSDEGFGQKPECDTLDTNTKPPAHIFASGINKKSPPAEKIKLFMELFKGREDVYAKRWENSKKGKSGYSPSCMNEWRPGVCGRPKEGCGHCSYKLYEPLNEKVIENHLMGRNNFVAGIYPLLPDETCNFLAIDFDGSEWQKDISALKDACEKFNIPAVVERSRSGKGAHCWFFFIKPVLVSLARKFGSALLTYSMSKRHEIKFESYDRLFPNQDLMPKGGFGNLIALPLQKKAREKHNSEFIDENYQPYVDQWAFLGSIQKLSEDDIKILTSRLCSGSELGELIKDGEEQKPWEINKKELSKGDFPAIVEIVKANMIFIPKAGISQRGLNYMKRLAAFKNPEFYKAQAMRLSVKKLPRVISCSDETDEYLCLPRGCDVDLKNIFENLGIVFHFTDKTNHGKAIDVEFNGTLRDEQQIAMGNLLRYDNGVLSGTTAFGKTVVAIRLIAEMKVNTLIIVDKVNLLLQWENKLTEFLTINETLPDLSEGKKRGIKKVGSVVGQLGAGKDNLNGIIDIALMQSLNRMGNVKECVKDYGMVIVDECHHVSAFSFEKILKNVNAKYVYGLTATPTRKDGHHPIIFMQCGPVRYKDDAKKQAEKRPFEHYVIPRFTSMRIPVDKNESQIGIQDLYSEIVVNESRNQLIADDVVKSHENGRNCVVLTERTAHVEMLAKKLSEKIPGVVSLTGGMSAKNTREILSQIAGAPADKPLTLVATGKYIGEGFDEPRLDTLFLAMPISWKGTLQQYAGRLHRLCENKKEVQIYDYVDIRIGMLERMYQKRLAGYAAIGYKSKGESIAAEQADIIFDKSNFLPVFINDMLNATREILIVSPFITKKRTLQMMRYFTTVLRNKIKIVVVTKAPGDFRDKDINAFESMIKLLRDNGLIVVTRSNIHQKFAVFDKRIIWYGSINLLSFGNSEESMMRFESPNIANELIGSIEKD